MKTKLKDKSDAAVKYGQKLMKLQKKSVESDKENNDEEMLEDGVEATSSVASKAIQRKRIQREQIKNAKKKEEVKAANEKFSFKKRFVDGAGEDVAESIKEHIQEFIEDHPIGSIIALLILLLLILLCGTMTSCTALVDGLSLVTAESSYTASDRDILAVNNKYTKKEKALQQKVNTVETTYPGYDEYRYDVEGIGHDPYELAALLTVLFEDYTQSEVTEALQTIFDYQYQFSVTPETEIRYRSETRTGTREIRRANGEMSSESYSYTVLVPYEWHVLKVRLKNNGIAAATEALVTTDDARKRYELLSETKGNKPEIFGDNIYVDDVISEEYEDYDVPAEYLTSQQFANMHREAEKYLGYPYVWGGSNPESSFDCSGFVCYVINHCGNGWNVGRTTANGLKEATARVRASDVKAGDLIFFKGTYATGGASHVGIVVDPENKIMIHCGSPISYASYDTPYWRAHFYCYGRIRGGQ